jgi:uncharacterized protein (DUF2147 family)
MLRATLRYLLPAVAAIASLAGAAQAGIGRLSPIDGAVWTNPYGNVKVRTGDCAGKLCGWVIWATPGAEAEARDGGTARLVGTQLLEQYQPTGPRKWQGHVFVPDMGRSFYSTIALVDDNSLKVSGCILGGLVCKSQIWHRA